MANYMIVHKYDEETLKTCEYIKSKIKLTYDEQKPNIAIPFMMFPTLFLNISNLKSKDTAL